MRTPVWEALLWASAGFALGVVFTVKFAGYCVGLGVKQLIDQGLLKKGGS